MRVCAYCENVPQAGSQTFLKCSSCDRSVHVRCLKSVCLPGGLLGDIFFNLVCKECSPLREERVTRQKISWINIIILTLYNLQERSEGMSQRGYFHWRMHICGFIDKNWSVLFEDSFKKKKSWMGTVSGTLSHYCPTYFKSGYEELRESGWWRLTHINLTPQQTMELFARSQTVKRTEKGRKRNAEAAYLQSPTPGSPMPGTADESSMSACEDASSADLSNLESEQEMGTASSNGCTSATGSQTSLKGTDHYSRYTEPSEGLSSDCLFAEDEENLSDMDVDIEDANSFGFCYPSRQSFRDLGDFLPSIYSNYSSSSDLPSILPDMEQDHIPEFSIEDPTESDYQTVKSNVARKNSACEEVAGTFCEEARSEPVEEHVSLEKPLRKSLFAHTPAEQRVPPWEMLEENEKQTSEAKCMPMSEYEELQLLNQLKRASHVTDLPPAARRLYRKLCVRRQKRERNMPLFNLDNAFLPSNRHSRGLNVWVKPLSNITSQVNDCRILDRFYHVSSSLDEVSRKASCSLKYRMMGYSEPTCFYSPYTQRQLKPYIRRDYESTPLWLQLLTEIQAKANKNNPDWKPPKRGPVDYSYVRPHHISTINSLCCEFFYPGIDLSESLQYPDFSCVALYKKLIVGFAFMVPDAGYNEAYISFLFTRLEWRRAGIATFMLYHLIQTCMGKDVTLHVSATNPALILYQKFGFKVEEFVQDFYDKYFPADSKECKHALFLRLSR